MANVKLTQKPVVAIDATAQFVATKIVNQVREVVQISQADLKGLDGKSSIASITGASPANIPAVGQQVQYAVDNSAGFVVDQIVAVGTASTLKVVGLPTATSIVLENVDATPGVVATGTKIVPSASRGLPGTPGAAGANAFTTVTTPFTIPAFNANVTATVGSTTFMSDGMALQISGNFFRVASVISTTQVSLTNTLGSQSGTIAATSKIVAAGEPGSNAFTTVTNQFTIPALNANVTATVGTTAFMSDGMALQISGKFFRVASVTSSTQVSLTNTVTGQTGTIAATSKVVVAGEPGPAGTSGSSGGASGLQFTYLSTAGAPGAGQLRSANIAVSGTVTISPTDAQTQGVADVLPRLKTGAIVDISKDGTNKVRGTISADYNATNNSFNWTVSGVYGTISNNNTVYLSIFSDAPSVSSSGGFSPGTISATGGVGNTITVSNSSLPAGFWEPITITLHRSTTSGFAFNAGNSLGNVTLPFDDSGLAVGTYYYRAIITGQVGEKLATPQVSASVSGGSILSGLFTAFWKADEASGSLADAIGSNAATPNNSPTYSASAGLINGCVNFSGDGTANTGHSHFSVADNLAISGGVDKTIFVTAAVKLSDTTGYRIIVSKYDEDSPGQNQEWVLDYSANNFTFTVYDPVLSTYAQAAVATTATINNWYILMAWFDPTANTVNACVNNGAVTSTSVASNFNVRDSGAALRIGAGYIGGKYGLNGSVDCIGYSNTAIPTTQQRAAIYNGGAGYAP